MAGDWIKMRNNLWDDPRVSSLCDLTGAPEAMVIGGLYWLWASADEHSEDGHMPGLSPTAIDRKTGVKGLGAALLSIGWIVESDAGITIIRFDEHNGASAKRRCMDAQRKANGRSVSASDADIERTEDGQKTDKCGAREEKRREEIKEEKREPPSGSARGTRLPTDWDPGESGRAFAEKQGLANGTAQAELEKFRDHWAAKPGKDGTALDWQAKWRTWVRKSIEFSSRGPPSRAEPSATTPMKPAALYVAPPPLTDAEKVAAAAAAKALKDKFHRSAA